MTLRRENTLLFKILFLGLALKAGVLAAEDNDNEQKTPESRIQLSQAPIPEQPGPRLPTLGIMLGAQKPTFTNLSSYSQFYGDTAWQPSLNVSDFVLSMQGLALGWGVDFTAYTDNGNQGEPKSPGSKQYTKLSSGLSFTMLSYRLESVLKLKIPGFKYFNVNGWAGYQETWYQEVLEIGSTASSTSSATNTTTTTTTAKTTTSSPKPTVYLGWESELGFGFALNIYLNFLDHKSVLDMRRTTGFDSIYISPYVEYITKISNKGLFGSSPKGLDLSREVYGVAFNFEG